MKRIDQPHFYQTRDYIIKYIIFNFLSFYTQALGYEPKIVIKVQ